MELVLLFITKPLAGKEAETLYEPDNVMICRGHACLPRDFQRPNRKTENTEEWTRVARHKPAPVCRFTPKRKKKIITLLSMRGAEERDRA